MNYSYLSNHIKMTKLRILVSRCFRLIEFLKTIGMTTILGIFLTLQIRFHFIYSCILGIDNTQMQETWYTYFTITDFCQHCSFSFYKTLVNIKVYRFAEWQNIHMLVRFNFFFMEMEYSNFQSYNIFTKCYRNIYSHMHPFFVH